jgi:predicted O-linked N-acetylglucosamine transferase (SPINDLY family)
MNSDRARLCRHHADSLLEAGRYQEAIMQYRFAISLQPDFAEAYCNLGTALRMLGRRREAICIYQEALRHHPAMAEVYNEMGNVFYEEGLLEQAWAVYARAVKINPRYGSAFNNLGNCLAAKGNVMGAADAYEKAVESEPLLAIAHYNLGNVRAEQGLFDPAITAYNRAIALNAKFEKAYNNRGNALRQQGKRREAMESYQKAVQINPAFAEAYANYGLALGELGDLKAAREAVERAIQLAPNLSESRCHLGNILRTQGEYTAAETAFREAIRLSPNAAEAHLGLGNVLRDTGDLDSAVTEYREAERQAPELALVKANLGVALAEQGNFEEALDALRRALALQPHNAEVRSNLIYLLHFLPGMRESDIELEQKKWIALSSNDSIGHGQQYLVDRNPERVLRIGYVSPDFRQHVVGRNILPLVEGHDREHFEIVGYSGTVRSDAITEEFRKCATEWRSILGIRDEDLADMIRHDRIDILVDLSQHMSGNRLPVFLLEPAPVQVSFAGYPASTGLPTIMNRISDRLLEAETVLGRRPFGERVFCLDSFWCYDPRELISPVEESPFKTNGHVTFGTFNSFMKVNDGVISIWGRLLKRVPGARLKIMSPRGRHRARLLCGFEKEGVDGGRIEFVERCPAKQYFARYSEVDIILDTFPYNGHTTSLDALWMGVPVISLVGSASVSRGGLSILSNMDLSELLAYSSEDYIEIAVNLAKDVDRLAKVRSGLRSRMQASVLMQKKSFVYGLEKVYRLMWREWCVGRYRLTYS